MSDVFILGAGFSKAISEEMPLLADLSGEVIRRLPELRAVATMFPDNIEMWLTYLSQTHPWLSEANNMRNRALLLDACDTIHSVLQERMRSPLSATCPGWLAEFIDYCNSNSLSLLTLNYDTLVERCVCTVSELRRTTSIIGIGKHEAMCGALYSIPLTSIYMRAPGRNLRPEERRTLLSLYKLHGSINWYWSGATDSPDETLYFQPATTWKRDDPSDLKSIGTYSDKVPFIVPPLTDKLPYFRNATIRSLWSKAGIALRSATRVFCLGYSFPPTDTTMRFFLESNLPASPVTFYVINIVNKRDPELVGRFHKCLDVKCKVHTSYVCDPDPVPQFVGDLIHDSLRS